MRIETLQERIQNAKSKIEKKENTIVKKSTWIQKKEEQLRKLGFEPSADKYEVAKVSNDAYWLMCEISNREEDIRRNKKEIEEIKASLEKYEQQLAGEIEKESILLKDIPESMKKMQTELVERWDAWDIERRDKMVADYRSLSYHDYIQKYKGTDFQFRHKTNEQIHNSNLRDAKVLILDLYYRVKNITGEITDWSHIYATAGTHGFTVLNGFVVGKEGRAAVESILAGGWNIQRLHVRVLVKEYI